nr:vasotab [Drosophila suzukii]
MKSFIVIFCLFLISVLIEAQTRPGCPGICPAVYQPVCGEASVRGRLVRCSFGNGCEMGVSSCRHNINWRERPLERCGSPSPVCSQLR